MAVFYNIVPGIHLHLPGHRVFGVCHLHVGCHSDGERKENQGCNVSDGSEAICIMVRDYCHKYTTARDEWLFCLVLVGWHSLRDNRSMKASLLWMDDISGNL